MNNDTITINQSIKDALKCIDGNSKGAIAVVDENNKFVRIVTDGDIRRALLAGVDVSSSIQELNLEKSSISATEGISISNAMIKLNEFEIDHLPIVDNDNQVKSIICRKEISPILLSSPHMGDEEIQYVGQAFDTNWIAPLGPNVDGFETELAEFTGAKYAAAVSSGTAAIHLALLLLDVKPTDVVFCSSLTFAASVNPVMYQHATPVFIDSEAKTWNMSPIALEKALVEYASRGIKPKAVIVVNLYGQSADMEPIVELCNKYEVPIIEDAAESLGAKYKGKYSGTFGQFGIYSFNGNKIITTSGGGMLVSENKELIEKAKFLSTQARDPAPYYEHSQIGYNYRMSNVLAGIGRGQLRVLNDRVESRRKVFSRYYNELKSIPAIEWMEEPNGFYSNRWLTTCVLNPEKTNVTPSELIGYLRDFNIEARHVWKPMHRQPVFSRYDYFTHGELSLSDYLFDNGVCLPSGSNMSEQQQMRVIESIRTLLS